MAKQPAKNLPKATPTPWVTDSVVEPNHVFGSNGNHVAKMDGISSADAEFIVRAVNCHEELVRCLQQAREFVVNHGPTYGKDGVLREWDALIAKAEGSSVPSEGK